MNNEELTDRLIEFIDWVLFIQESPPQGVAVLNPITYTPIRKLHKYMKDVGQPQITGAQISIKPPKGHEGDNDRVIYTSAFVPAGFLYVAYLDRRRKPLIENQLDQSRLYSFIEWHNKTYRTRYVYLDNVEFYMLL